MDSSGALQLETLLGNRYCDLNCLESDLMQMAIGMTGNLNQASGNEQVSCEHNGLWN